MARILKRDVIKWVAENLKGEYRVAGNKHDGWDVVHVESATYYPFDGVKEIVSWTRVAGEKG